MTTLESRREDTEDPFWQMLVRKFIQAALSYSLPHHIPEPDPFSSLVVTRFCHGELYNLFSVGDRRRKLQIPLKGRPSEALQAGWGNSFGVC